MINQKHGLLSAERNLDSDSPDNNLFTFSVAPAGRVTGMLLVPVSQLDLAPDTHTDAAPDAAALGGALNTTLVPSLFTPAALVSGLVHSDSGTADTGASGGSTV